MDGTVKSDLRKDNLARQAVDKRHQQATNAPTCWSACIIGLIIFVLVGFGVGAKVTYSYYGLYWHVHNWYHERDQVLVSKVAKDLNSVLCQSFTVDTNVPASVFLTDGPAKVDKNFKEIISYEDNGLIFDDSFNYRAYYLLQGSKIEIFACMRESVTPRVPAEVVIIKSEDQYRKWLSVSRCSDCPLQRIPIPESKLCASFQGINATIHIEEEDTYYVIITRQHRDDIHTVVPSSVTVKISKVMYDSRMSKQHCAATTTCQLDLAFGADDDVIVQFEGNFPASSAYFSNKCRLRVAFWATVFGAIPGAKFTLSVLMPDHNEEICTLELDDNERTLPDPYGIAALEWDGDCSRVSLKVVCFFFFLAAWLAFAVVPGKRLLSRKRRKRFKVSSLSTPFKKRENTSLL